MAPGEATRVRLSAQSDTMPDVLHGFATDVSVMVRAALALNPSAPSETNAALAGDPDERVRALVARKLGLLLPSLSAGARDGLSRRTLEMLTALAEDETVRVRAVIADAVKDMPETPRAIILRLAYDAEMTVCEPVIRFSPLLTSADLVALVVAAPSAGTGVAVARRAALDTAVTNAVASKGTDDAVLALLMNGSAQIREATLDGLVDRSVDHPAWHDPLVRRPALSDRSIKTLSWIVADHLLEVLAARSGLDPVLAADLRARVSSRLQRGPEVEEPSARADKPAEADLLAAVREGDARKAAVMLAAAADVPLRAVRHAAALRSAKGLVSLTWKAGFSMRTGHAMQVLLAGLSPGTALKPGPGNTFPLSPREMLWQVEFLIGQAH
jgi:uncharacterized protein (DUF2336 family)